MQGILFYNLRKKLRTKSSRIACPKILKILITKIFRLNSIRNVRIIFLIKVIKIWAWFWLMQGKRRKKHCKRREIKQSVSHGTSKIFYATPTPHWMKIANLRVKQSVASETELIRWKCDGCFRGESIFLFEDFLCVLYVIPAFLLFVSVYLRATKLVFVPSTLLCCRGVCVCWTVFAGKLRSLWFAPKFASKFGNGSFVDAKLLDRAGKRSVEDYIIPETGDF